jgi:acetylglutamate kinase
MSFSSLQDKKMKSSEFLKGEVSFEQKAEILLEVLSSIPSFVGETFVINVAA